MKIRAAVKSSLRKLGKTLALAGLAFMASAWGQEAAHKTVEIHAVDEQGVQQPIGEIAIKEEAGGLTFEPDLRGLEPGVHGFHVHQYADCGPRGPDGKQGAALAAGSHLDPEQTGQHGEPWSDQSHLGDLPALYVTEEKQATQPVHVAGLKLEDVEGHALVIHAQGDTYSDEPQPLGGGGERVACGTVKEETKE